MIRTNTGMRYYLAHLDAGVHTGPTPMKPSKNTLELCELLAVAQARRLRGKQLVLAAAKVHGGPDATQPHVDGCELEHIWAVNK